MVPDLCGDPYEGWGPASRLRPFDLTPCFEEGVLLSGLLVVYVVLGIFRCWALRGSEAFARSRVSVRVLRVKVVSF